jgi:hypothetical protein
MTPPGLTGQLIADDERMNCRPCINEDDWDLQQPLQPLKKLVSAADIEERTCECVQVDVDEWDARCCLLHGPNSVAFRKRKESEAADLVAYYSGPDPFGEPVRSGSGAHRPAVAAEAIEESKQRRTTKGGRKMKEVVRFAVDTPVEVALRFETGKHVEGRYGDQIMYSLVDNRVMYVPPYVEQRIRELAIGAGEPLQLCKQAKTDGNRKWMEWSVRRAPQQPRPSANETAAAGEVPSSAQNHADGNTNETANDHANSNKAVAVMPNVITGGGITAMEMALNGAAEIAQRVEGRAASKNYSLRFSNEDIRAIALTIFIQAMREGGVRWQQ